MVSDAGLGAVEVDGYDPATGSGFRVLVTGRTEFVLDADDTLVVITLDRLARSLPGARDGRAAGPPHVS